MKNAMGLLIVVVALLTFILIRTPPVPAGAGDLPQPEQLIDDLSTAEDVVKRTSEIATNFQACRARGGTEEQCASLAIFCDIREALINQRFPGFVSDLRIFDAFQVDCGNGQCFQCCNVPGQGCHTSFIGYPVINCNLSYGPGTHAAGITQIVDEDAQPGDACLFTPQTCEHIPACLYNDNVDISALEQDLLNGLEHALNWPRSINQRAHLFGRSLLAEWGTFLSEFTTEKQSIVNLMDFVTGRGCRGWHTNVSTVYPFEWTDEPFVIRDESGQILAPASHLNGLQQLGTMRILASIPNIADRLAGVDSRVWTEESKTAYLAQVGDPDAELLRYVDPVGLEVIKRSTMIQDYRLLAVPLPDETPPGNSYNGCELGLSPEVSLAFSGDNMLNVTLEIAAQDLEWDGGTARQNPILVDWGDGSVSHYLLPQNQSSLSATHTYSAAGKYLVYAIAENDSGLRGIGAIVVEAAGQSNIDSGTTLPTIANVTLEDLTVHVETLSGNVSNHYFELQMVDDASRQYPFGLSRYQRAEFNVATEFGDVIGRNSARVPLEKIVIKPHIIDGFTIGLREWYFTAPHLTFGIYSTVLDDFVTHSVEVPVQALQIYAVDSPDPLPADAITFDDNGNIKYPLRFRGDSGFVRIERIEILLSPEMFDGFTLDSNVSYPVGTTASWRESRPGHFGANESKLFLPVILRD